MRTAVALVFLLLSMGSSLAQTKPADDGAGHGTINVVLGNGNGIVVLTDSMITLQGGQQSKDWAQKLFKVDDRTVCTFAGFAYAPGEEDFFYVSAAAVIQEFIHQLSLSSQSVSLGEKLNALSYTFAYQLTALANVRKAARQNSQPFQYWIQLTMVGYDIDGVPKIGQVRLRNTVDARHVGDAPDDELMEYAEPSTITPVGRDLVSKLAGLTSVADMLLQNPKTLQGIPEFLRYANAKESDRGQSLTIAEMKDLAMQLALQSSNCFLGVGGPDQIAILQNGRVVTVKQGTYKQMPKIDLRSFGFLNVSSIEGQADLLLPIGFLGEPVNSARGFLFVNDQFTYAKVGLDNNYFSGDVFRESTLVYDGSEAFYFGNSNTVTLCVLEIGSHAKRNSKNVKHLLDDYNWLHIEDKRPKT